MRLRGMLLAVSLLTFLGCVAFIATAVVKACDFMKADTTTSCNHPTDWGLCDGRGMGPCNAIDTPSVHDVAKYTQQEGSDEDPFYTTTSSPACYISNTCEWDMNRQKCVIASTYTAPPVTTYTTQTCDIVE